MTVKVPFLREEQIEHDAEALLADFERACGIRIVAPVPIEDIVEKHLKIRVEFDELHELLEMRIRLENLGLLLREFPMQRSLANLD
jgi:hypothetical protein